MEEEIKTLPEEIAEGVLEVVDNKDYGFLRFENFSSSDDDVYVSPAQIRKLNLKTGDKIKGHVKKNRPEDKFPALTYILTINGESIEKSLKRPRFRDLTPIHPKERLLLSSSNIELSTRLMDVFSPVGKGQRGMIVAPPKAGKTILLTNIAKGIEKNHPECYIMVLLIDERPEEVTEMKRSIQSEVIASTFDEPPSNHIRVAEMVMERGIVMAEMGKDVVILMDSITRLARAYNLETTPSGRTLSGGLDPAALHKPKRFFGTARNIEEGGSITILATALIDTGSRMDDVIFEEFKGTGNMELILSRDLAQRRVFPAIDILNSGTRREELLLDQKQLGFLWELRKNIDQVDKGVFMEELIRGMYATKSNDEFIDWARKYVIR